MSKSKKSKNKIPEFDDEMDVDMDVDMDLDFEETTSKPSSVKASATQSQVSLNTRSKRSKDESFKSSNRNLKNPKREQILDEEILEQENPELDINFRRMDSLARLIEGSSECAAVCFDGEKLLIASNTLYDNSRENSAIKLIEEIMSFFADIAVHNDDKDFIKNNPEHGLKVFDKIIQKSVPNKQKEFFLKDGNKQNPYIEKLGKYFFSDAKKKAENLTPKELAGIAGFGMKLDDRIASCLVFSAFAIERLATDWKKFTNFLHEKHNNDDYASGIVEAFKNLTKLKQSKSSSSKPKKLGYKILKIGAKDNKLHAEMQIIQELIDNQKKGKIYIGISKLCCLDCSIAISSYNQANNEDEEISQTPEELNESNILQLLKRGDHNLSFKWSKPDFCKKNTNSGKVYNKLHKKVTEYKELLSASKKTQRNKDNSSEKLKIIENEIKDFIIKESYTSMQPPPSSSSPHSPSGSEDSEQEILKNEEDLKYFDHALSYIKEENHKIKIDILSFKDSWKTANNINLRNKNLEKLRKFVSNYNNEDLISEAVSGALNELVDLIKKYDTLYSIKLHYKDQTQPSTTQIGTKVTNPQNSKNKKIHK